MNEKIDRTVFRDLSYGLYIVTSKNGDKINGQIVNTVIQVTSDPPRATVIINKKNLTHDYIKKSNVFSAAVLEEETPMAFLGPFGFRSGRDFDKFSGISYKFGVTGCPLVQDHVLSVLEAEVSDHIELGTHTIFIGAIAYSEVFKKGSPLTYHYYHNVLKGKSPPNAPTFEPKQ